MVEASTSAREVLDRFQQLESKVLLRRQAQHLRFRTTPITFRPWCWPRFQNSAQVSYLTGRLVQASAQKYMSSSNEFLPSCSAIPQYPDHIPSKFGGLSTLTYLLANPVQWQDYEPGLAQHSARHVSSVQKSTTLLESARKRFSLHEAQEQPVAAPQLADTPGGTGAWSIPAARTPGPLMAERQPLVASAAANAGEPVYQPAGTNGCLAAYCGAQATGFGGESVYPFAGAGAFRGMHPMPPTDGFAADLVANGDRGGARSYDWRISSADGGALVSGFPSPPASDAGSWHPLDNGAWDLSAPPTAGADSHGLLSAAVGVAAARAKLTALGTTQRVRLVPEQLHLSIHLSDCLPVCVPTPRVPAISLS
jgi:hypothetical protein